MIEFFGNRYFETVFCMQQIQRYIYELKGIQVNIGYPNLNNKKERELFERFSTYALGYYGFI